MKQLTLTLWLTIILHNLALAQEAQLSGQVSGPEGPLTNAVVRTLDRQHQTVTDTNGRYRLQGLKPKQITLQVRHLGYQTQQTRLTLSSGPNTRNFRLQADILGTEEAVVTATRSKVSQQEAPVRVNRISAKDFENSQSTSLSEGLNFSPGLRLETNCQNCGFTQLRMNGLEGPYSQILINSRPIFSALAGVYGLDMIPTNMIDRVEVVRGGGSALYGGSAIAGTVNIITKEPATNSFEASTTTRLVRGQSFERILSGNASVVSEDLNKGLTLYAYNRDRQAYDANGDDFTELVRLRNNTFGMDAFLKPDDRSKLKFNLYSIGEFRRGGNQLDRPPHQADLAEELDHSILGGSLAFDRFSENRNRKLSIYSSAQYTQRDSYYGAGGRIIDPGDTLTPEDRLALNAYGNSEDLALVNGARLTQQLGQKWQLTAGSEWQFNAVEDRMPGYQRLIDQSVSVVGGFAQAQYQPLPELTLLAGGRLDHLRIDGLYELGQESLKDQKRLTVFVPRATLQYQFSERLQLRATYAQGYRGPQAFNEDLHIATVGGAARFIRLSENLQTERSNSYTASLEYSPFVNNLQANFVAEGFLTRLQNPFITANQKELPSGIGVASKRNGQGARVFGTNIEANIAFSKKLKMSLGGTLQAARFDEQETLWEPESPNEANRDSALQTQNLTRTPSAYGFWSLSYEPFQHWSTAVSGTYTGSMDVPHIINPDNEFTVLEESPDFWVLNLKLQREFHLGDYGQVKVYGGVKNLFNSYQSDFDKGQNRDADYIYGPASPRTYFLGLSYGLE